MSDSSLLLALVFLVLLTVHGTKGGHSQARHPIFRLLNTGSVALAIGLVMGSLVALLYDVVLDKPVPLPFQFDLYMVCLPVFVYQQGFSTKSHELFSNIVPLVTLGVFGTIASSVIISFASYHFLRWVDIGLSEAELFKQSIAIGVILSSTDSVAALTAIENSSSNTNGHHGRRSRLFYLVFGEGIFNDATAIVLLRSVNKLSSTQGDVVSVGITLITLSISFVWMMLMSLGVGLGIGLMSAFVLKRGFQDSRSQTHSTDREVAILFTLGLLSYFLAEQLGLSGVFAIFFCGVTQSHYAWYNLSASAQVVSVYTARVMSVVAEIVLFLGTSLSLFGQWDTIDYTKRRMMHKVMVVAPFLFALLIVARFLVIVPMLAAMKIRNWISIFLAGSVRGAVTLALAVFYFLGRSHHLKHHEIILCASIILITIVSTMGLGTAIALFFERTNAEDDEKREAEYEPLQPPTGDQGDRKNKSLKRMWVDFDRIYMQPVFGGKSTATTIDAEGRQPAEQHPAHENASLLAPLFSLTDSRSLQRAELQIDAAILGGE